MTRLSPDHRLVLLHEVEEETAAPARGHAATKMLRMRARRRLATILEASAVGFAALVARARRLAVPETAVALTAAAVVVAGAPIFVVAPLEKAPQRQGPRAGAESSRRVAAAPPESALIPAARATPSPRTEPAAAASAVSVDRDSGGSGTEPFRVPVPGGEVGASAEVEIEGISVTVGETGGPLPVCVGGVSPAPHPVSCDPSPAGDS